MFTQAVLDLVRDLMAAQNDTTALGQNVTGYRERFKEILSDKAEASVIYYLDIDRWLAQLSEDA